MRSRQYQKIKEKAPAKAVALAEAISFLKANGRGKFDETIEVHMHLSVDPERSEQSVRGSVVLPHGTPKQKQFAVFTSDPAKQQQAKDAGASLVGGEDLIVRVAKEGTLNADLAIATPDMMPKIAKIAKILGPKGLMPNPKTGTVTPDPAQALQELKGGKVTFKMDKLGNMHEAIAKLSWPAEKIAENIQVLHEAVKSSKPASVKGSLIKTLTVKSTMSAGIRIEL
jgi:large subunit ribosomal protein L1